MAGLVLWSAYTPVGQRYITAFANDQKERREHDTDRRIIGYCIEDQLLGQDLIRRGLQYQRTVRIPPPEPWQILPILITIGIGIGALGVPSGLRCVRGNTEMKNVQVIDGADNAAYNIYEIPDDGFELIFPDGQDIEFIEDLVKRIGRKKAGEVIDILNKGLKKKSEINGIHGTLFYELRRQKKRYYPNKKFSDDPSTAY